MASLPTSSIRKNLRIVIDGVPFQIVEFQHVSPGKGSAFTRTRIKNMLNNNTIDRTFKNNEKVEEADTEQKEMQYLYKDSEGYHFMNQTTYDQEVLSEDTLGDTVGFLQENVDIKVMYFNGKPIGVEPPTFVVLKVTRTDPAFKGDTVTGGSKPATLETGATVNVPFHIVEGDLIKVDTRNASYVEKANK